MRRNNLHSNFKDLNPIYHKLRHERAVKVANRWIKVLGENLIERYKDIKKKNFNEHLMKTNNLRAFKYEDLRNLSTSYKNVYHKI